MSAQADPSKRRLLLASDNCDNSRELERILQSVGEVDTVSTSDLPETPDSDLSGISEVATVCTSPTDCRIFSSSRLFSQSSDASSRRRFDGLA